MVLAPGRGRGATPDVMNSDLKKTALLSTSLRLICTDYDGTIAEADGREILPLFFERLVAWRKRGPLYWVIKPAAPSKACRRT